MEKIFDYSLEDRLDEDLAILKDNLNGMTPTNEDGSKNLEYETYKAQYEQELKLAIEHRKNQDELMLKENSLKEEKSKNKIARIQTWIKIGVEGAIGLAALFIPMFNERHAFEYAKKEERAYLDKTESDLQSKSNKNISDTPNKLKNLFGK